jgi:amino acid transporter
MKVADTLTLNEDEQRLAELGHKQELRRSWSGFSNFAISFSIISILAGCFTTFAVGWNNGGPAAIAWGWPIVSAFILVIGLCMSELVSAYPTSGGIYWWASKLGGAKAGYYTGWLNLIGLLAIDASVAYGCATFFDLTLSTYSTSWANGYSLSRVFLIFMVVLTLAALVNIFSSQLLAILNNISVWWHVAGAATVVAILIFVPDHHASVSATFTDRVNNTGFFSGHTSGFGFLFYVLPLSVILTQYTITGYDASAHLSEETNKAANSAARGLWRSIFYSAIGGWILLLSFLFAVQDEDGVTKGGGAVVVIFNQALSSNWAGTVLLISTAGQFFCTVACMTSTTRMLFAFSRDGAVPGGQYWSRLNANRVPVYGVVLSAIVAVVLTLPALVKVDIGGAPVPVAFFAVVSIGVVGLYVAFAIPIFLRWGRIVVPDGHVDPRHPIQMDVHHRGRRDHDHLDHRAAADVFRRGAVERRVRLEVRERYDPRRPRSVVAAVGLVARIGEELVHRPKITVDLPEGVSAADEIALEHHGGAAHLTASAVTDTSPDDVPDRL